MKSRNVGIGSQYGYSYNAVKEFDENCNSEPSPVKEPSEVDIKLIQLEHCIDLLSLDLNRLYDKLEPVVKEELPSEDGSALVANKAEDWICPLSRRIEYSKGRIYHEWNVLCNIIDRISL